MANEHEMLGDWIILIFRPCYKAHTSPSSKLGDYIGTMHLAMHLSFRISLRTFLLTLAPRAYVTYYQTRGLSGHTSPCGEYACFLEDCTFYKSNVGTLHREKKYFFSRAPCILRTTFFFDVNVGQLSSELVKIPLQLFRRLPC